MPFNFTFDYNINMENKELINIQNNLLSNNYVNKAYIVLYSVAICQEIIKGKGQLDYCIQCTVIQCLSCCFCLCIPCERIDLSDYCSSYSYSSSCTKQVAFYLPHDVLQR